MPEITDEQLLAEMSVHIRNVSNAMVRSYKLPHDYGEDLAQEMRMSLLRLTPQQRAYGIPFLHSILNNSARNALKKLMRPMQHEPVGLLESDADAVWRTEPIEKRILIKQCFKLLSPKERQVMALYAGINEDGKPITDLRRIGSMLGFSKFETILHLNSAKSKLSRVLPEPIVCKRAKAKLPMAA